MIGAAGAPGLAGSGPGSRGDGPGSGGDVENRNLSSKQIKKASSNQSDQKCDAPSLLPHGIGLQIGGNAELGAPDLAGIGGSASKSLGVFNDPNAGLSAHGFESGGGLAYAGAHSTGAPAQNSSSSILGASFSAGAAGFLTNATSVQQLSGPFTTYSLNIGVGPAQVSVQLSIGGRIWQLSLSPPLAETTEGLSVSKMMTSTATDQSDDASNQSNCF